jgi:hypothetical protein
MLHLTHSSRYHWGLVGGPKEEAIGDWQLSRVYAAVDQPALALRFGEVCLETCQQHQLSELLSTAYEAIARAHGVAGRPRLARDFLQKARGALDASPLDPIERKILLGQIRDTESKIG